MNPQTIDRKPASAASGLKKGPERTFDPLKHAARSSTPPGGDNRPGWAPVEHGAARERRRRAEELARQLPAVLSTDQFVALAQEHGRLAMVWTARYRSDVLPEINGEYAHIALSLADLD